MLHDSDSLLFLSSTNNDSNNNNVVALIVTIIVTLGITYIFYPAIILAWHQNNSNDNNIIELTTTTTTTTTVKDNNNNNKDDDDNNVIILLSIVIPAYNEQDRITVMLESAHEYLISKSGQTLLQTLQKHNNNNNTNITTEIEWIIVNDGSNDDTIRVVQDYHQNKLQQQSKKYNNIKDKNILLGQWKIVSFSKNMGKGAAVKAGMLVATGQYQLMVDADGATEFGPGLEKVVHALCQYTSSTTTNNNNKDSTKNNNIAIFGSRAHLQKESTTQRSMIRTILMYGFHFFVSILVSKQIQDTQCGFKLFTKSSATQLFTKLHLQRWAFDTELVMLADTLQIHIQEVPVPWHEVDGSKLNTSKFALAMVSITMLRDMICVRACYTLKLWK